MVRFSRGSYIGRVLYAATASVLSVVAVALASGTAKRDTAAEAHARLGSISGALRATSPTGTALDITGLQPGASTYGTVRLVNDGRSGGLFTLSRPTVADAPGAGGGSLSRRLQVTVLDVTGPGAPDLVHAGGLAGMKGRTLTYLRPGQARTYLLGASFIPGPGPASAMGGDDAYAGGSARVSFDWAAVTASEPRPTEPIPTADRTAPRVRIAVAPRQDVLGEGLLTLRVRCDEPCRAKATLASTDGARREVAAQSKRSARARESRLTVRLPQQVRDALRERLVAGQTVVFEARATARDRAGNEAAATRRIGLNPTP